MQKIRAENRKTREVECMDCQHSFEVRFPSNKFIHGPIGILSWPIKVSGTDEALECPNCDSRKLKKQGGTSFRFVSIGGVDL